MGRRRATDWDWQKKPLRDQTVRPALFTAMIVAASLRLETAAGVFGLAMFLPWEIRPPSVFSLYGSFAWAIAFFSGIMARNYLFGIAMFLIGLWFWGDEWKHCYQIKGDGLTSDPTMSDINTTHLTEEIRDLRD